MIRYSSTSVMMFLVVAISVFVGLTSTSTTAVNAFVPQPQQSSRRFTPSTTTTTTTTTTTQRMVMMDPNDIHSLATDHHQHLQHLHQHSFEKFTSLMTAAAADATTSSSGGGWWKAYLNIFKTALSAVHSTIDGPLRSVGITQTWGPAIALFTAGVRSCLIPLSFQQSKGSEYIKALKPYMAEIKEKFKDSPEAQNRAIGKLYEDAKQNPFSGCLLSLAQIPIFLGLYRGVRLLAMDGQLDEPFLWIPNLQGPVTAETDYRGLDWLTQNWVDGVPSLGWETTIAFCIMPVILVLGQSLTMSVLQPPVDENASDEERESMEKTQLAFKFLPLMIGFFSLQVPAGLTIYWFTSNVFTLTQSLLVRKYYEANPPEIELPEYWDSLDKAAEEMSLEEKKKAAQAGIAIGPKFEDLVVNSNFHTVVERKPLRLESGGKSGDIPIELQTWVGPIMASSSEEESESSSEQTIAAQPAS